MNRRSTIAGVAIMAGTATILATSVAAWARVPGLVGDRHDPQNPRLGDIPHCLTSEGVARDYPCQWECAVDGDKTCGDQGPVIVIYGQRPWPTHRGGTR